MNNDRQCVISLHKPSRQELIFFFSCGILLSFPFALFFSQTYSFFPYALALIVIGPFVEELAKVFPIFYRHGETERSYVTIGALIGLGFGISELALYVFFLGAPLISRVPGVIFHSSSASITAYGIAKKNPLPYYLIAVMLHITINFFAYENVLSIGFLAYLAALVVAYLLAWNFYQKASKEKMVV